LRCPRKAIALVALLACAAVPGAVAGRAAPGPQGSGQPPQAVHSRANATLSVEGPARLRLSWLLDPASLSIEDRAGDRALRAPGYGLRPAGAGFRVPFKIEYVAIPEGVTPRLERVAGGASRILLLGDLPRAATQAPGASSPRQAPDDPAATPGAPAAAATGAAGGRHGAPMSPDEFPVSLGPVGYFRDQRFVEVRVSPARPTADGIAVEVIEAPAAVLTWDPSAERRAAEAPQDPRAEGAYHRLFLNFEEGRAWRVRHQSLARAPGGPGAAGSSGSTLLPATSLTTTFAATDSSTSLLSSATSAQLALPPARARIRVTRDGLVRIDQALLSGSAPALASADPRTLRLTYRGQELPIRVQGEAHNPLQPGDFIEFYGTRRVEPSTVLTNPGAFLKIYSLNDFTDMNVYWLEAGASAPLRVAAAAADPTGTVAIAPHWQSTARLESSGLFRPFDGNDPWVMCPRVQDRSSGSCSGSVCCDFPSHDFQVALTDYTPVTADAAVRVFLQGWTTGPHVVDLSVNGTGLGTASLTWDNLFAMQGTYTVANTAVSAASTVRVSLPGNGTGTADSVVLDAVEIDYRRLFKANTGALEFRFPDQQARFAVDGFASSTLVAYDLSRSEPASGHPVGRLLTGVRTEPSGSLFRAVFQQAAEGGAERRFLVAAPEAIAAPAEIVETQAAPLCDPALGADLIVIGHSSLIDMTPGSPLDQYVAHRAAQGLRVRVVNVQDVYDQFGCGFQQPPAGGPYACGFPDPRAIKEFLACTYETGAPPPPMFVLLLGDGTSDYKNQRGLTPFQNLVVAPVHAIEDTQFGYYSSDEWMAAFRGGDALPDALIGRISAGTAAEAANALGKIVRYESAPAAAWRSAGLFVAGDGNNAVEDSTFVEDNLSAASHFTAPFSSQTLFYGQPPYNGTQFNAFNSDLLAALDQGQAVVNYVGHGNFTIWDQDVIFKNADVASLTNVDRLPVYITSTCLMTGYHLDTMDSLGELLVQSTPDTGGIAVVAPSGLSNFNIDSQINQVLYDTLMGPARERTLGDVVLAARLVLAGQGSFFDAENLTILGDPALKITLPAPAPASGLSAQAGNARVDLSWQVSPDPDPVAGYHVYRTQARNPAVSSGAAYTRVTSTPVAGLSYADTQAVNTTTYAYAVTAVDASGFESAWSTFNSTCGVSLADCVQATPYNPNPPSVPTGLSARDPAVGFQIDLTWNPNPETDLKGYTVLYRTESGAYSSQAVGLTTKASIAGLNNDSRYFFAVIAVNTSDGFTPPGSTSPVNGKSAPSAEVSAVPTLIQGIRPPAMIRDLRISVAADLKSLRLDWTKPLVDIYGNPATVVGFQVHRGYSVDFKPTVDTLATPLLTADTTSWVDTNALLDARNFFYFVLAQDGSGLLSSASRVRPTGVNDLRLVQAIDSVTGLPNGNLTLSWGAVTHDIEGVPVVVDHYDLYGSSNPFGRASIGPANLVTSGIRALSYTVAAPAGRFYYLLIAVDRRGNESPF